MGGLGQKAGKTAPRTTGVIIFYSLFWLFLLVFHLFFKNLLSFSFVFLPKSHCLWDHGSWARDQA